jgi:hypothetical protein
MPVNVNDVSPPDFLALAAVHRPSEDSSTRATSLDPLCKETPMYAPRSPIASTRVVAFSMNTSAEADVAAPANITPSSQRLIVRGFGGPI